MGITTKLVGASVGAGASVVDGSDDRVNVCSVVGVSVEASAEEEGVYVTETVVVWSTVRSTVCVTTEVAADCVSTDVVGVLEL